MIQCIPDELNVNIFTLKEWLRKAKTTMPDNTLNKRPTVWVRAQRFFQIMYMILYQSLADNFPVLIATK